MGQLRRLLPLVVGLACFVLVWKQVQAPKEPRKGVRITLSAMTPMSDTYQLFYDTIGQGYGPQWSSTASVKPSIQAQELVFDLPPVDRIHGLRLDPGDHRTSILLYHIRFDGPYRSTTWNADDIVQRFTVLHDLDTLRTIPHENTAILNSTGMDPFIATGSDISPLLEQTLDPVRPVLAPFTWAALAGFACAMLLARMLRSRRGSLKLGPIGHGWSGAGLVLTLACSGAIFFFTRALLDQIRFKEHPLNVVVTGSFPHDDDAQVFYDDAPNGFTREALVQHPIAGNAGAQLVNFHIPMRTDLHYLRFDPGMFQDTLWLDSLTLSVGHSHLTWNADTLLKRLVPNGHIARLDMLSDRLRVITQGNDPFFTIDQDLAPVFAGLRKQSGNGPLPTVIAAICALFFLLGSGRTLSAWVSRGSGTGRDKLVVILFAACLIAPLTTSLTGTEPELKNTEKRLLAQKPPFTMDRTLAYPTEFTTYYEENFGLRKVLFRWNSYFIAKVLRTSPLPERTLFGKDGWMFYMREDAIPRYESICTISDDQLSKVADRLEQRRKWLAAQGIEYVIMIPPEKSAIYPDKLPARIQRLQQPSCLDRLAALLRDRTQLRLVDVRSELKDARALHDVYYTTDTHWNPVGAWFGYAGLINAIRTTRSDVTPPMPFSGYDMYVDTNDQGDLSTLIGLNDVFTRVTPLLVPRDSLQAKDARPGSYATSGFLKYPPVVKEVKGSKAPRLLMFRDSFMVYMIPSVSEHFSRSTYIWTPVFIPQIVAEERPDIVVHEVMEFYLSDLLQDDLPLPPLPDP